MYVLVLRSIYVLLISIVLYVSYIPGVPIPGTWYWYIFGICIPTGDSSSKVYFVHS